MTGILDDPGQRKSTGEMPIRWRRRGPWRRLAGREGAGGKTARPAAPTLDGALQGGPPTGGNPPWRRCPGRRRLLPVRNRGWLVTERGVMELAFVRLLRRPA